METKTHWKKLINVDYIGAYSLDDGKDMNITIESVGREMVKGTGGKKEECTVAKLVGQKPFILNRTNSKMLQKLTGSPFIEDWQGVTVTIYATTTAVAGETVECLRIRPTLPQVEKIDYEQKLKDCKTLDELKAVYISLPKNEATKLLTLKDTLKDELSKN